eukprot:3711065-Amphidinium_carterae.2
MAVSGVVVVLQAYSGTSQTGISPTQWLGANMEAASLVLPADELKTVLALESTAELNKHRFSVLKLCESGLLGNRIFGPSARGLTLEDIAEVKKKHAETLSKKSTLSKAVLLTQLALCVEEINTTVAGLALLSRSRSVAVSYQGIEFQVPVKSVAEEVEVMFRALARSWARMADKLTSLPGEADFTSDTSAEALAFEGEIDTSIVAQAGLARQHFATVCRGESELDGQRL